MSLGLVGLTWAHAHVCASAGTVIETACWQGHLTSGSPASCVLLLWPASPAVHILLMAVAKVQENKCRYKRAFNTQLGNGILKLPPHSIGHSYITELKVKGLEYRPHFFCGRWCKIHMSKSVTTGRGGQLETIMQSTSFIFISLQQIFMGYIIVTNIIPGTGSTKQKRANFLLLKQPRQPSGWVKGLTVFRLTMYLNLLLDPSYF